MVGFKDTDTPAGMGMTHDLRPMTLESKSWRRGLHVLKKLSFFVSPLFAADLTLEDLMKKAQANQAQIKDMYAETETTMISNMTVPGQTSKGPQKMVQTGKMWTKVK